MNADLPDPYREAIAEAYGMGLVAAHNAALRAKRRANGSDTIDSALRPLTIKELRERPYPVWLVRGVIIERGFGVAFGASGSGKTFLIFDAAASIGRGGVRWFGCRVRQGGVIYVSGEGHLKARVEAYLKYYELDDASVGIRCVTSSVNLLHDTPDTPVLIAEIRQAAAEMGGVVLVVLDTLNSMMPGGNENSSEDMGAMVAAARAIMAAIGCAVIYIHHSGKNESLGSRGHSSLKAATDFEIQVTEADNGDRVAEVTKVRDGERGQRFGFRLLPVDLGPDPDPEAEPGERLTSCVVEPLDDAPAETTKTGSKTRTPKNCLLALKALRDVIFDRGEPLPATGAIPPGSKGVSVEDWRSRYQVLDPVATTKDEKETQREMEARKKRFARAKEALLNDGTVMACSQWVWIA